MFALSVLGAICWIGGWIFAWVRGSQTKNAALVFFGAFFTLFLLGLVIALIQTTNWRDDKAYNMQANFLEMQKQKLELEKLALEREKIAKKKEDKVKEE